MRFFIVPILLLSCGINRTEGAEEDCPWYGNSRVPLAIKANCLCARNQTSQNQLSVQCHKIEGPQLVNVLLSTRQNSKDALELLYLNGSHVTDANGQVPPNLFRDLKMVSLQLSSCNIKSIHPDTFRGQEAHMKHLSLSQNQLTEVPVGALERLTQLVLLDMSYNKITKVPDNAFHTLNKLSTLKLNDNNLLDFASHSFNGLETSLRNLNLKATRISTIPEAIGNLSSLAFLDLAQNRIRELDPSPFKRLHSLTVLNLERNLLRELPGSLFIGVNDTLSSLSLLNNLITVFPKEALRPLHELRVLDLGFNLLTEIPPDAFSGLRSLTLLALDGNSLNTLPEISFRGLNNTLRGLSLGGGFLYCDCRIKWVQDWIQKYDLQITSRERNPQFCGYPNHLRSYNFYQLKRDDLKCNETEMSTTTTTTVAPELEDGRPIKAKSSNHELRMPPDTSRSNVQNLRPKLKITPFQRAKKPEEQQSQSQQQHHRPSIFRPSSTLGPASNENEKDDYYHDSDSDSEETHDAASSNQEAIEKPVQTLLKPASRRPFQPSSRTTTTTSTTTTTTTTATPRRINSPAVIKPFPGVRIKTQPKVITTTTSSVSSTSSSSSNSDQDIFHQPPVTTTEEVPTIKPSATSGTTIPRQFTPGRYTPADPVPGRTVYGGDFDDTKIPVITGVGPIRTITGTASSTYTTNAGNSIPVRSTTSISPPPVSPQNIPISPSHTSPSLNRPPNLIFAEKPEIFIRTIDRNGESVQLQWESQKHVSGFRIIYRIFGEDTFRHGPALAASDREFRLKNIPTNECVVVCVVPFEEILYNEINPSAGTVPPGSQCRELKPNNPSALMSHMDKITIGASAAICATVLLAVFLFIMVTKRSKGKRTNLITKIPPGSMASPSPGPQAIITTGTLAYTKEWDQQSAISVRSIPRAKVYHGGPVMDGNMINGHNGVRSSGLAVQSQRTMPDGHSTHRSYLSAHHAHHNHSVHAYHANGNPNNTSIGHNTYLNNQSRLLRASLGSRSSQDALNKHFGPTTQQRQFEQNQKRRRHGGAGRLSHSDSLNTLSGYETPDNWTDHDMDVYVARNATRHDLVQL